MPASPCEMLCCAASGAAVALAAQQLCRSLGRNAIVRQETADPRASGIVECNGTVYLSGQVGIIDKLEQSDCAEQTRQTLAKVDRLLALAGTSKSRILTAQIWLRDIDRDFQAMNGVWNAWVDPQNKGARACVQSAMARPGILVEVSVIAAK
eukprot:TRINITY_DN72127_c0_g1_i1.p2 TRINITY_DN72127_c0_g1~~TRINITY_DN72127_c0_g1_i1.p2  ORF type:complete len:178 (+),score=79.31 TRINITY_DN72127_c0_g1_i1:80-535(+)